MCALQSLRRRTWEVSHRHATPCMRRHTRTKQSTTEHATLPLRTPPRSYVCAMVCVMHGRVRKQNVPACMTCSYHHKCVCVCVCVCVCMVRCCRTREDALQNVAERVRTHKHVYVCAVACVQIPARTVPTRTPQTMRQAVGVMTVMRHSLRKSHWKR